MSDLAATHCDRNSNDCSWIIFLIVILACCGGSGSGFLGGRDSCGSGGGFLGGGDDCGCALLLLVIFCCCGGGF